MATPSLSIEPPKALPNKGNLADNWRKWKQNFEIYLGAAGIDQEDPRATLLFLHNIGQYGRDIFNELVIPTPHSLKDFFEKFDDHCIPKRSITFERYTFFNTKQEANQSFDKFCTLLKQRSLNCEFGELTNSLMVTQIIIGIQDAALRKRLLKIPDITLNDIIEECKTTEIAQSQSKQMEASSTHKPKPKKTSTDANAAAKHVQKLDLNVPHKNPEPKGKPAIISNCKFCSGTHPYGNCPSKTTNVENFVYICKACGTSHDKNNCPAFGTTCHKCKKPNHFTKLCTRTN